MRAWPLNRREFIACGAASLMSGTFSPVRAMSGPNLDAALIDPDTISAQHFLQALAARGVVPRVIAYEPCACRLPLVGLPEPVARIAVFLPAAQAYVVEQHALMRGYRLRLAAQPLGVESNAMIDHYSTDELLLELDATSADWAHRCARLCSALYGADIPPRGERRRQRLPAVPNNSATFLLLQKSQTNASSEAAS